jgi:hypothetical protein
MDGAHKEVMRTLGLVCGVFARRLKESHGAVGAYVREVESTVRRETDADVAFGWIGRLIMASIELRTGDELTTENKITEVMHMFETILPRIETVYVSLAFVKRADIRAAMQSVRRAKRLVAYALFSALGEKHAVLHIVRFDQHRIGLVVYAECIGGAWEIYYTPLQQDPKRTKDKLILDEVSLRSAKPKSAPQMYRIQSIRERDTKRTEVALAVLSTDAPINVPDPNAIASPSTSPVLFTEYANTQLKVYREIAQRWARWPYPRFGRTLLSLLRTWRVAGEDVMVDVALLDVLYKIDDHDDRVALTFDELTKMVKSAKNEYDEYQKPWDNDDNKTRLKAIQAIEEPDERFSDAVPIAKEKIPTLNTILDDNIDRTAPTDIETIMGRPAAELASFLSIKVDVAKTGIPTLNNDTNTKIKEKLQSENINLTRVTGLTKQEGKAESEAKPANEDSADAAAENVKKAERLKLGKYWAMVYKILHAQTNNIGTCLEKYREWYEKAFSNDTDVRVVWDIGKYDERQHLGTILVGSYIVGHYKRDVIRRNEKVWVVYKKKSEDSFEKGMFKKGDDRVTWTEYGASLGKTSVRFADIVSARRKVHGPYYTEKQVIRAILDPPKDTLRAIVDKNKFWIECDQPKIDIDAKHYTKWDVLRNTEFRKSFKSWLTKSKGLGLGVGWSDTMNFVTGGAIGAVTPSAVAALGAVAGAMYGDYSYGFTPLLTSAASAAGSAAMSAGMSAGLYGALGGGLLGSLGGRYFDKPASEENQAMLRQRDYKTIGDEAASAAIPRVDDTFNLGAFHFDASPDMCALALQNAERAAIAVTDPRI